MVSKTFVTAFVATCLMAGCEASPCKASSKTIEASTTVITTDASTETSPTTDTATATGLTTGGPSSTEDVTVSVTLSQSASETFISSADTSMALSSTEISSYATSIISESTTITFEPSTTASIDTTTSIDTYTDTSTTTTSIEAPIRTNLIINGDFEADTELWYHDPESASMDRFALTNESPDRGLYVTSIRGSDMMMTIGYPFSKGVIKAGLDYSASAWIRPGAQCDTARISCRYNNVDPVNGLAGFKDTSNTHEQWNEITTSCTFTQDQVNMGGLVLEISFWCSDEWNMNLVDSVVFI
ncbi:hypothetical protein NW768_001074 [Fusarium equiseti]|uniref:CBM-cenC domain-containing protein n=1 Tax=Fusarium equiseti TaxID=61235 RepID=A0ABQ8RPF9_FUSEQ|nr:hypothetical protein NW768_001074 [Fusarium equiseti]